MSEFNYSKPAIISQIFEDQDYDDIQAYTSNSVENVTGSLNDNSTVYMATMTHTFISHCSLLGKWNRIFRICGYVTIGLAAIQMFMVFCVRRSSSKQLQYLLTVIPFLAIGQNYLTGAFYQGCPWYDIEHGHSGVVRFGKVSIDTFTMLYLQWLIFLLCRGWKTTVMTLDRWLIMAITLIICGLTLLYAPIFLCSRIYNYTHIYQVVNVSLTLVYFTFGLTSCIATSHQIKLVRSGLNPKDKNAPVEDLKPALRMKQSMLRQLRLFAFVFYMARAAYQASTFVYVNEYTLERAQASAIISAVECANFIFLLWIFRPRSDWPQQFDEDVDHHEQAKIRKKILVTHLHGPSETSSMLERPSGASSMLERPSATSSMLERPSAISSTIEPARATDMV